jgi:hypothetical protein
MKFNNEYLTTKALECPSPELKCALDAYFAKNTTVALSYVPGTKVLTVTINGVAQTVILT